MKFSEKEIQGHRSEKDFSGIKEKILCVVLVYYEFQHIRRAVDALINTDALDLVVVENKSEHTDTSIKPYILDLVHKDKVLKYFLFDKNISNNAIEVVLDSSFIDYSSYDYVLVTDGDLEPIDSNWLHEQLKIINNNPDVFVCGIDLDMSNLPVNTFPNVHNWIPKTIRETEDYLECTTGLHYLLFRKRDFTSFLAYRRQNNLHFVDGTLHHYCYNVIYKKWAKTKVCKAIHLTWDSYQDLNHPYTKLKLSKSLLDIWSHNSYSPVTIFTKETIDQYYPMVNWINGRLRPIPTNSYKKKLHLGCGSHVLEGWINIDLETIDSRVMKCDLTKPLPFMDEEVAFIFSEHFVEHITREQLVRLLTECNRVLQKGGVVRISTPSLEKLVQEYLAGNIQEWQNVGWLPATPCQMLNEGMRSWGHMFVYDYDEMYRVLHEAGFNNIQKVNYRDSSYPDLRNLETRPFHNEIIVEAVK